MRMIANILGCPFQLSILSKEASVSQGIEQTANTAVVPKQGKKRSEAGRSKTVQWQEEKEQLQEGQGSQQSLAGKVQVQDTRQGKEGFLKEETAKEAGADAAGAGAEGTVRAGAGAEGTVGAGAAVADTVAVKADIEVTDIEEADAEELEELDAKEVDMTIGELYKIHEELSELEEDAEAQVPTAAIEGLSGAGEKGRGKKEKFLTGGIFLRKKGQPSQEKRQPSHEAAQTAQASTEKAWSSQEKAQGGNPMRSSEAHEKGGASPEPMTFEPVIKHDDAEENLKVGDVNPYTGREFQTNSVRMHPSRIGYVQVYDRKAHKWTDMTEWAFLGYQERKKALLGKEYEPPIYLD